MSTVPFVTYVPPNMNEEFKFLIQACGSRIAVLFQPLAHETDSQGLVVWDWKSGQQKLVRITASCCGCTTEGSSSLFKMKNFDLSASSQKT